MAIDEQYWRRVVSGENAGPGGALLRPLLRAISWPYAAASAARRRMYANRWKRSYAAATPVISVGNITTGGTGKTPLVAWVVRYLASRGRRPAILTRGYKAVEGASDEAMLLEQMTGAPVVVNPDRVAGAAAAAADGADVLVMDDGFQHVRLQRGLDIVAIDATCPFGYDAVLPRGLLREPVGALGNADAFVLTRCDLSSLEELAAIRSRLASVAGEGVPIIESSMKPVGLRSLDGRSEPVETLADKRVWAFCGLGNPDAFYRTVAGLAAGVLGETTFNDHHAYDTLDIQQMSRLAHQAGARFLVTTAKDAVKFAAPPAGVPIRWLEIDVEFADGGGAIRSMIDQLLSGDPEQ